MEFESVTGARSRKLNETLVLENLVLLMDLVTLEKERKKSSIIVVVAENLAVYAPLISVRPRLTAAAYTSKLGTIPYFHPKVLHVYHSVT